MALNNKRVNISAETLQGSTRIANYSAILDVASKKNHTYGYPFR